MLGQQRINQIHNWRRLVRLLCEKTLTKEDFKTNWRSHQMRQIIAKAKIHLDKKGGA